MPEPILTPAQSDALLGMINHVRLTGHQWRVALEGGHGHQAYEQATAEVHAAEDAVFRFVEQLVAAARAPEPARRDPGEGWNLRPAKL